LPRYWQILESVRNDDEGVLIATPRRSDATISKIWRIPKGSRYFPAPLRCSSSS